MNKTTEYTEQQTRDMIADAQDAYHDVDGLSYELSARLANSADVAELEHMRRVLRDAEDAR